MAIRTWVYGLMALATCVPLTVIAFPFGKDHFVELRRSAAYQQAILNKAKETSAYRSLVCDAARLTLQGPLYTLNKPTFDRSGKAEKGDWAERIVVQGCGPDYALNILVHVKGLGSLTTEPMLPGTTKASLQLQMDSISFAFEAARVDRNGCKPIFVLDTEFKQFFRQPNPKIDGQPWSEFWTIAKCDKRAVVKMTFVPDSTGTAINASSDTKTP